MIFVFWMVGLLMQNVRQDHLGLCELIILNILQTENWLLQTILQLIHCHSVLSRPTLLHVGCPIKHLLVDAVSCTHPGHFLTHWHSGLQQLHYTTLSDFLISLSKKIRMLGNSLL